MKFRFISVRPILSSILPIMISLVIAKTSSANATMGTATSLGVDIQTNSVTAITIDAAQKVGIGVPSPLAVLHLPAGSTAASSAPIKLNAGTLMTTPEAGAIEYDGTNLYITDSGGIRRLLRTYVILSGNTNNSNLTAGNGIYYAPANGSISNTMTDVQAATRSLVPRSGYVTALYALSSGTPGANVPVTVRRNGSAQTLTCTILAAGTSCNDTNAAHVFAVSAGDELGVQLDYTNATTNRKLSWAIEISF